MSKEELLELSDTLRGIAERKEWEYCFPNGTADCWHLGKSNPLLHVMQGRKIRLKPWKLPDPPPGQQWHREDGWTEEMLPDGYRPLLMGEFGQTGDEYLGKVATSWQKQSYADETESAEKFTTLLQRTTRPLPEPPKQKKRVPLGPEDVPPGSVIRMDGVDYWVMVTHCGPSTVSYYDGAAGDAIFYRDLSTGWQIKRPTDTEWQPCWKEVDLDSNP